MRTWLRQHRQAFAAAISKLAQQRSAAALNALVIGIALALPAGGHAVLGSLRAALSGQALEPQLSLFLQPEAKRADAEALGGRLKGDSRIAATRFVPREQALKDLQAAEGMADVVASLGRNPLPDGYVIRPGTTDPRALDALAADLKKLPGVAHVQVDSAWARRLAALTELARLGTGLLALLFALGLVAITFNTIRLQILTQRAEIEISRLIGATDAFIRRPFFYLGGLQGLAGGVVALGIVGGGLAILNTGVADLAASYGSAFRLSFLRWDDSVAVLAFAALLGWLGAYLAVSRHLLEI